MPQTRQSIAIPLIGNEIAEICGNQLPLNKQVLQCYFYHTRHFRPKLTAREAARAIVRKCAMFWDYAGIPMVQESYAIEKLETLVKKYKSIQKDGSRKNTDVMVQLKISDFEDMLENLFDIAHQKQMTALKDEYITDLLALHRRKGRKGFLNKSIDIGTWALEIAKDEKEKIELSNQDQLSLYDENYGDYVVNADEDIDRLIKEIDDDKTVDPDYQVQLQMAKRKKITVVTPDITAVLDRAKISDRMAARVLAATLMQANISLDDVNLSRETIRRNRRAHRELLNELIHEDVKRRVSDHLCVHWDGKQQPDPENKYEQIDRLSVLISNHDWQQLLGVPGLKKGSGENQATAVYQLLKEWEVHNDVCAMVFDTSASNTGNANSACVWLEKLLGRDLLYLACRHHVLELLLKVAFESSMGCTSGPNVPIFKRFQGQWRSINKEDFSPGINDLIVKDALHLHLATALDFAEARLKDNIVRHDYREFLELIMLFLGGKLTGGNRFRALVPIHHARWMSKAIYSLKIFLFRDQFHLTASEKSGLINTCIFIVFLYQKAWFTASQTATAPQTDSNLLKALAAKVTQPDSVAPKLWKAVFDKFSSHLWYLSEELIALAFFDENVSAECKRKMCIASRNRPVLNDNRKKGTIGTLDLLLIGELDLDTFVTKRTFKFFDIMKIDSSLLDSDPITWEKRDDFVVGMQIVKSLQVTNDIAERSVALVTEYNDLLTRDENSKQNLMRVVERLRALAPGRTKEELMLSLQNNLNYGCG